MLDTEYAGALILDITVYENMTNKFTFLKPPGLWYLSYNSPKQTKIRPDDFLQRFNSLYNILNKCMCSIFA